MHTHTLTELVKFPSFLTLLQKDKRKNKNQQQQQQQRQHQRFTEQ